MRLIDADALTLCNYDLPDMFSFRAVPKETLDRAPTINAVEQKHGHWVFYYGGDDWCAECSICGNSEYGDTKEEVLEENPYCRKCGAKMGENKSKRMTDEQVIEIAEQIIEATNKLIDYCNETGGCKNCIFSKFRTIQNWYHCPIKMQDELSNAISNLKKGELKDE